MTAIELWGPQTADRDLAIAALRSEVAHAPLGSESLRGELTSLADRIERGDVIVVPRYAFVADVFDRLESAAHQEVDEEGEPLGISISYADLDELRASIALPNPGDRQAPARE